MVSKWLFWGTLAHKRRLVKLIDKKYVISIALVKVITEFKGLYFTWKDFSIRSEFSKR